jgi:hypothetical protein
MKIAPAPYTTVEVGCGSSFHCYIVDRNGRKIGVAWGPLDEKVWTAALFAAAPDLLEYVQSSASAGCATAKALTAKIAYDAND